MYGMTSQGKTAYDEHKSLIRDMKKEDQDEDK